jgi:predicted RNase H-like nuclease (RuvC/YqgF family)
MSENDNPADAAQDLDNDQDQDEPSKTYTQEQLEKKIKRRTGKLASENETLKAQLTEFESFKNDALEYRKWKESQKSEIDRIKGDVDNEKKRAEKAEADLKAMRDKIALDKLKGDLASENKLPSHLIEYVTGSNKEEISESIKKVKAHFGIKADKGTHVPNNPANAAPTESEEMNGFLLGLVRGGGGR